jgi:hypothetical protein
MALETPNMVAVGTSTLIEQEEKMRAASMSIERNFVTVNLGGRDVCSIKHSTWGSLPM